MPVPPARSRAGALAVLVITTMASACSLVTTDPTTGLLPASEVDIEESRPAPESRVVRVTASGPPVELPSGLTLSFEAPPDGLADPATKAVLDDSAMLFAAVYQAIGHGDPRDGLYQRYAMQDARDALRDVIAVFASNDWTVTGTATIYHRTAEVISDDEASVAWCADLRSVFPMEVASGHVLKSTAGDHSYLRYEGTMKRRGSGLWVMMSLESRRADPACL